MSELVRPVKSGGMTNLYKLDQCPFFFVSDSRDPKITSIIFEDRWELL